jgi:hypothetical protein
MSDSTPKFDTAVTELDRLLRLDPPVTNTQLAWFLSYRDAEQYLEVSTTKSIAETFMCGRTGYRDNSWNDLITILAYDVDMEEYEEYEFQSPKAAARAVREFIRR